ncbi:WW domain-containing adapter protein with coiled-coil homolog [Gigantopelta aegis]|uniref:WW domain-containing adapter protein with coiled-coil homolog n=1 Tax=Gigantopelta aegis TaxID=1735272 RepID=UPI001B88B003|nr:WW domain-containing adapter protein with coiled-coil homolog [Gigantopelta aegis]
MVMHARKLPRLNDGYADRKDSHLHQNMPYQSKSFGGVYRNKYDRDDDRSSDDGSGSRNSSRYHNKSSYIERNKEKRGSVSVPETKSNNQVYGVSTSGGRSGQGSGQSNTSTGQHNHQDRYTKSTIKDSKDQRGEKEHRVEVQKSAVRVFGDWSEHISSSGKRYYYNCRTEVSQWEKPKECAESPQTPDNSRTKESRTPIKSSHPSSSSRIADDRCKHSTSDRDRVDSRYSRSNSDTVSVRQSDKSHLDRHKMGYTADSPNSNATSHRTSTSQRNNSHSDSANSHKDSSTFLDVRKNSSHSYSSNEAALRRQRHESEGSRSSFGHTTPHKNDESAYVHTDSMDISPGNTPTGTRQASKPSCTAALQTLQKLQEALNLHINRAQQMAQNVQPSPQQQQQQSKQLSSPQQSRHSVHHLGNNIQGPPPLCSQPLEQNINSGDHHHHDHHQSPVSDASPTWSPKQSTNPTQIAPVTSALSGAIIKKEQSVELTPSLSNYFNEKLIGHVLGWQAEHVERQAHLYCDEGLALGSLQCSRVSVELKKDRSLVRTAEIQSTLHEQRILFLDKQISEIDGLKTPSTFLPS